MFRQSTLLSTRWLTAALAAIVLLAATTACRGSAPAGDEAAAPAGAPAGDTSGETVDDSGQAWPASKIAADTVVVVRNIDPESLDPSWTYESAGIGMDQMMYDRLVAFEREKPNDFVPSLATEWSVSDDGLTYTFTIRQGVTFHAGGTLGRTTRPTRCSAASSRTAAAGRCGSTSSPSSASPASPGWPSTRPG